MSTCQGCNRPVVWVLTENGKNMPLDPDPDANGNVIYTDRTGLTKRANRVPVVRVEAQASLESVGQDRYLSHFATCPNSDYYRHRTNPGTKPS